MVAETTTKPEKGKRTTGGLARRAMEEKDLRLAKEYNNDEKDKKKAVYPTHVEHTARTAAV